MNRTMEITPGRALIATGLAVVAGAIGVGKATAAEQSPVTTPNALTAQPFNFSELSSLSPNALSTQQFTADKCGDGAMTPAGLVSDWKGNSTHNRHNIYAAASHHFGVRDVDGESLTQKAKNEFAVVTISRDVVVQDTGCNTGAKEGTINYDIGPKQMHAGDKMFVNKKRLAAKYPGGYSFKYHPGWKMHNETLPSVALVTCDNITIGPVPEHVFTPPPHSTPTPKPKPPTPKPPTPKPPVKPTPPPPPTETPKTGHFGVYKKGSETVTDENSNSTYTQNVLFADGAYTVDIYEDTSAPGTNYVFLGKITTAASGQFRGVPDSWTVEGDGWHAGDTAVAKEEISFIDGMNMAIPNLPGDSYKGFLPNQSEYSVIFGTSNVATNGNVPAMSVVIDNHRNRTIKKPTCQDTNSCTNGGGKKPPPPPPPVG